MNPQKNRVQIMKVREDEKIWRRGSRLDSEIKSFKEEKWQTEDNGERRLGKKNENCKNIENICE